MEWPRLIPSSELLDKLAGVERGLEQRKRYGRFGALLALGAAIVEAATIVLRSEYLKALSEFDWEKLGQALRDSWLLVGLTVAIVAGGVIYLWSRFWLRQSREASRYTCFIDKFAVAEASDSVKNLTWLPHDLVVRLAARVARLSFTPTPDPPASADGGTDVAHFVVAGTYVVRQGRYDGRVLEITPMVRLGAAGAPATSLEPISIPLDGVAGDVELAPLAYETLCERVYFAVGSEIYKQIRESVRRRVALLPTQYHRANALFHEAVDQAGANTLDALDEAIALFEEAREAGDACARPLPAQGVRRAGVRAWRWLVRRGRDLRRWGGRFAPSLVAAEAMRIRIDVEMAIAIAERRFLAVASSQPLAHKIFVARRLASQAVERLHALPRNFAERDRRLYDAHIAVAFTLANLDDLDGVSRALARAEAYDPQRAGEDARFFLLEGHSEARPGRKIALLGRACDLRPRHEISRFLLACALEDQWRRGGLGDGADFQQVVGEYDRILETNPGIIGAWANKAYIRWLTADAGPERASQAHRDLELGLDYARGRRSVFVGELRHGLLRIAAERGDFAEAFRHVRRTVDAQLAALSSLASDYAAYYCGYAGRALVGRFERYVAAVERAFAKLPDDRAARGTLAFVLDDAAAVYDAHAVRTGDHRYAATARAARQRAEELDPDNVVIRLHGVYARNLHRGSDERDVASVARDLGTLAELLEARPDWLAARDVLLQLRTNHAARLQRRAQQLRQEASKASKEWTEAIRAREAFERATRTIAVAPRSPAIGAAPGAKDGAVEGSRRLLGPRAASARVREPELSPVSSRAITAQRKAQELLARATAVGGELRTLIGEICAPPRGDLPHPQLWVGDTPKLHRRVFELRRGQLWWEREFTEQDARVFCTWVAQCLRWRGKAAEPDQARPWRLRPSRRSAISYEAMSRRASQVFWPNGVERDVAFQQGLEADGLEFLSAWCAQQRAIDPTNLSTLRWELLLADRRDRDAENRRPGDASSDRKDPPAVPIAHGRIAHLVPRLAAQPHTARWVAEQLLESPAHAGAKAQALGIAIDQARGDIELVLDALALCKDDVIEQRAIDVIAAATIEDPELAVRAALVLLRHGLPAPALDKLHALPPGAAHAVAEAITAQGERAAGSFDPIHARPLVDWLEGKAASARAGGDHGAAAAWTAGAVRLAGLARGRASDDARSPVFRIVIAPDLLGEGDSQELLQHYREHAESLRRTLGVALPRWEDAIRAGGSGYSLAIGSSWIEGSVPGGAQRFFSGVAGGTAFDPWTGRPDGAWQAGARDGAQGKSVVEYILRHARRAAEDNAPVLLSYDDLFARIVDWCAEDARRPSFDWLHARQPRLLRVLRRLLAESVPIVDTDRLLEAFLEHCEACADDVVLAEHLRLAVRDQLPGASVGHVVRLSAAFEAAIAARIQPGIGVLAVEATVAKQWRRALAHARSLDAATTAVVVAPQIRPQVRRLVDRSLPVLSTRECSWKLRELRAEVIAHPDEKASAP